MLKFRQSQQLFSVCFGCIAPQVHLVLMKAVDVYHFYLNLLLSDQACVHSTCIRQDLGIWVCKCLFFNVNLGVLVWQCSYLCHYKYVQIRMWSNLRNWVCKTPLHDWLIYCMCIIKWKVFSIRGLEDLWSHFQHLAIRILENQKWSHILQCIFCTYSCAQVVWLVNYIICTYSKHWG